MGEPRLDTLRRAARLFDSERAIEVCKRPSGYGVWFRVGARSVAVLIDYDSEDSFGVNVHGELEYEGMLRLSAFLVKEMVDGVEHKSLLIEGDGFYVNSDKRYYMLPGPSYSLLALGVVIASFFGFFLYETPIDLEECKRTAQKLLNDINAAAEVPKTREWKDNPELLEKMAESYINLVVWSFDYN
jgi:hypothetical protein